MADIDAERMVVFRQVYLNVCALNRPLDDQSQMRIQLKTDAVLLILSYVKAAGLLAPPLGQVGRIQTFSPEQHINGARFATTVCLRQDAQLVLSAKCTASERCPHFMDLAPPPVWRHLAGLRFDFHNSR